MRDDPIYDTPPFARVEAKRLARRDRLKLALDGVYPAVQWDEVDALLDKLEDHGLEVVDR